MKMLKLLSLTLLIVHTTLAEPSSNHNCIHVVSVKSDIFYFKVHQALFGGTIEVYSPQGELIFSDLIAAHKIILDFYSEDAGLYRVKIIKDNTVEEFEYAKTSGNPFVGDPSIKPEITVTQHR